MTLALGSLCHDLVRLELVDTTATSAASTSARLVDTTATSAASTAARLELGHLCHDLVRAVIDCCPPAALLVLRRVSKGWRACIHALLRDARWAARHHLPERWMAALRRFAFEKGAANATMLTQFQHLSLRGPDVLGVAVAVTLFSSSLQTLDLGNNTICDAGAVAISAGLKVSPSLEDLYLLGNSIGCVGAAAISEGLKLNASLKYLSLGANNIGDAGAVAISGGLKANTVLKILGLSYNQIGDVGGVAIGDGLSVNVSLNVLNLSNNSIGNAGATAIGVALRSNDSVGLRELFVSAALVEHPALKAACAAKGVKCWLCRV